MSTVTTETHQMVVFSLVDSVSKRNEEYGVGIEQVQEIRVLESITRLPNSPVHVKGVTNLRGKIISIIDLKQKLGFVSSEINSSSRILVAEINGALVGLLVDQVDQVMRISSSDIEPAQSGNSDSVPYIRGIAKMPNRLIVILDLEKLLGDIDGKLGEGV